MNFIPADSSRLHLSSPAYVPPAVQFGVCMKALGVPSREIGWKRPAARRALATQTLGLSDDEVDDDFSVEQLPWQIGLEPSAKPRGSATVTLKNSNLKNSAMTTTSMTRPKAQVERLPGFSAAAGATCFVTISPFGPLSKTFAAEEEGKSSAGHGKDGSATAGDILYRKENDGASADSFELRTVYPLHSDDKSLDSSDLLSALSSRNNSLAERAVSASDIDVSEKQEEESPSSVLLRELSSGSEEEVTSGVLYTGSGYNNVDFPRDAEHEQWQRSAVGSLAANSLPSSAPALQQVEESGSLISGVTDTSRLSFNGPLEGDGWAIRGLSYASDCTVDMEPVVAAYNAGVAGQMVMSTGSTLMDVCVYVAIDKTHREMAAAELAAEEKAKKPVQRIVGFELPEQAHQAWGSDASNLDRPEDDIVSDAFFKRSVRSNAFTKVAPTLATRPAALAPAGPMFSNAEELAAPSQCHQPPKIAPYVRENWKNVCPGAVVSEEIGGDLNSVHQSFIREEAPLSAPNVVDLLEEGWYGRPHTKKNSGGFWARCFSWLK